MKRVTFIDTSVLCELVQVPGKSQRPHDVMSEFRRRVQDGEGFVLPITALIETGNHIAQASGNRRSAAERLANLMDAAARSREPFVLHQTTWDADFLDDLCGGDSTGQPFVDLAGNGQMGAGDVAILVERDRFLSASSFERDDVKIWTLEATMGSYA